MLGRRVVTPSTTAPPTPADGFPWWTSNDIANELTDPFLRSYLWAYPAGIDWFAALAALADEATIKRVLHGTFERRLSPTDLTTLWPAGTALVG